MGAVPVDFAFGAGARLPVCAQVYPQPVHLLVRPHGKGGFDLIERQRDGRREDRSMSSDARRVNLPGRSLEQRRQALERANAVRVARAKLKKDLASGNADLAPLIVNPPEYAATAKVVDLLVSVPKIGQVRAHQILGRARIAPQQDAGRPDQPPTRRARQPDFTLTGFGRGLGRAGSAATRLGSRWAARVCLGAILPLIWGPRTRSCTCVGTGS